jgi:hypothetical protein
VRSEPTHPNLWRSKSGRHQTFDDHMIDLRLLPGEWSRLPSHCRRFLKVFDIFGRDRIASDSPVAATSGHSSVVLTSRTERA